MKKYLPSIVLGGMLMVMMVSNTSLKGYLGAQLLPALPSDSNLTLYLPLDGDVNDPTTISKTVQIQGNPTIEQNCKVGSCYRFDGLDDFLDTGKTTVELGVFDESFTAMAWVKGENYSTNGYAGPMNGLFGTDPPVRNAGLHLGVRDRRPYFGMYANDTDGSTPLAVDTWVHLAFRMNKATGEQSIFVNGVLDAQTGGHPAFGGQDRLTIGRVIGGNYFDGLIDEVRIYSKALTLQEIQDIVALQPSTIPPSTQPQGLTVTSNDIQTLSGKYYTRVAAGETGAEACKRVATENNITGSCIKTSQDYDTANPNAPVCQAFHPTASIHDASTQNTSDPSRSAFGTSNIGYCESADSITCDADGALRDSTSPSLLTNTCHTCSTCKPSSCETDPQSIGLDELYVECSFTDPQICTSEDKTIAFSVVQTITEEFSGEKDVTNPNNGQLEVDLVELIRDDLQPGERAPDDILLTKLDILQNNASNINLIRDGQTVQVITKPAGTFSVPLSGGIRADKIVIPPTNGFSVRYTRERVSEATSPQSIIVSNSSGIRDLSSVEDLPALNDQIPSDADVNYRIENLTGPAIAWFAPASFEGTLPLNNLETSNIQDRIFVCKDADGDEVCDQDQCPGAAAADDSIVRDITVGHQPALQVLEETLLGTDEIISFNTSCDTCVLNYYKDPSQFKGGQTNSDDGFFIHVRSIDSADGSVSHSLVLFGPTETMDGLIQQNGKSRFSFITPSVLNLAENDYAFRRVSPSGVTEVIPVEGQVLEDHIAKPLMNGNLYPHLFLIQSLDNVWLIHSTPARYWNISTLSDTEATPRKIKEYFDLLPSAPTPEECESTLGQLPDAGELLENANNFQVFLDLLTLCNRL